MSTKYISNDTIKQLKTLKKIKTQVSNYSQEETRIVLLSTGIYLKNGKLKPCYK